ncbi:ATP-binding cassette, sub-B (MDR TAP), member 4, partial [Mortierella sp. AD094]
IGTICSIINGIGQPVVAILMGDLISNITGVDIEAGVHAVRIIVIKFTVVGGIMLVASYGQMCCWTLSAENQSKRIREKYLHAILRQDMTWHDTSRNSESLNSHLSADTELILDGLAYKVGVVISGIATLIAGFVIAFTHGWKITFVLIASIPLMGATELLMSKYTADSSSDGQSVYAVAGGLAEQAIGAIRTAVAFDGQGREIKKFEALLNNAYRAGIKNAIGAGLGQGFMMCFTFLSFALVFWFGAREVHAGRMETSNVLTVLFSTIIGAFSLGDLGLKPTSLAGHIVLRDVDFVYPARPDVPVLKKMSIEIKPGQTVALVGLSGSGKSTIIGLLERFYDPTQGSVQIDGIEVKDFNVRHLRDRVGLVSQEPILFNATIKQNIIYGVRKDQQVLTDQEIEQVCRIANAHDFVSRLPDKYETLVGEKGALLSGGQKQRIAIARALIKYPSILLLDEATSALDTESERIVQEALDKASAGRSTVVVAHRLSTVMNADVIYVMEHGEVVTSGTHETLLAQGGIYFEFVANQQLKTVKVTSESAQAEGSSAPYDQVMIAEVPVSKGSGRMSTTRRLSRKSVDQSEDNGKTLRLGKEAPVKIEG